MDVEVRHLRALVAVVDAGTFTDAAARLGTSQASVSRAIAALETALGARLLQRTTRHVSLTSTGTRILPGARRVVDEMGHLYRVVEQSQAEPGRLRLGRVGSAYPAHAEEVTAAHRHPHHARR